MAYSAILLPQLFEEKSDITITLPESTWIGKILLIISETDYFMFVIDNNSRTFNSPKYKYFYYKKYLAV